MRTLTLSLFAILLANGICQAQQPYGGYGNPGFGYGNYGYGGYGGYSGLLGGQYGGLPGSYLPSFRSPVSPYLNLLNSGSTTGTGNAGVNYFNFVRPFTIGPGRAGGAGMGGLGGSNALRGNFFPTLNELDDDFKAQVPDLAKKTETDKETLIPVQMAPTGHQAGFGNTLGYFGPMMAAQGGLGSRGIGAQQMQQRR